MLQLDKSALLEAETERNVWHVTLEESRWECEGHLGTVWLSLLVAKYKVEVERQWSAPENSSCVVGL